MKLIESIQYTPADQIVRWIPTGNSVTVQPFDGWSDLPLHITSGEYSHSSKSDKSGTIHTITINARLREHISLPELLIIKVNFCDGSNVVIGSPDIPVEISSSNTLYLNTISISHNTSHNPRPTTD